MDEVQLKVAATMLGAFVCSSVNPGAFGLAAVSMTIYWGCALVYYGIDKKDV